MTNASRVSPTHQSRRGHAKAAGGAPVGERGCRDGVTLELRGNDAANCQATTLFGRHELHEEEATP